MYLYGTLIKVLIMPHRAILATRRYAGRSMFMFIHVPHAESHRNVTKLATDNQQDLTILSTSIFQEFASQTMP